MNTVTSNITDEHTAYMIRDLETLCQEVMGFCPVSFVQEGKHIKCSCEGEVVGTYVSLQGIVKAIYTALFMRTAFLRANVTPARYNYPSCIEEAKRNIVKHLGH